MRTIFIACVLTGWMMEGLSQSKEEQRVSRMKEIDVLLGKWDLQSKMISPRRTIEEKGTMTCQSLFGSTYIECDVRLSTVIQAREYKTLITYEPDSARYEQVYFYSGSPQRIIEVGTFTGNELKTSTTFIDYSGKPETVTVSFVFKDKNNLFMESRSSSTDNEVDYQCTFRRKAD